MRGFSFLRLVYKLLEFFCLADNVRCGRKVWHGWERKASTISVSQLGMIFIGKFTTFFVNWRLEDFFGQGKKFETDLVRCFAHVFLLCMCVSFKSRPLQDKIATRAFYLWLVNWHHTKSDGACRYHSISADSHHSFYIVVTIGRINWNAVNAGTAFQIGRLCARKCIEIFTPIPQRGHCEQAPSWCHFGTPAPMQQFYPVSIRTSIRFIMGRIYPMICGCPSRPSLCPGSSMNHFWM